MGGCNIVAMLNMADMVCLVRRKCGVHKKCWVCMFMFELSYILVVLIWIVFDVENCEVSSAKYLFHTILHLVPFCQLCILLTLYMNRPSECREYVVCIVGKM